jgi:hypothetical protein
VLDGNRQEVTMELHVLAATDDGTLWHSSRKAGKWGLFCKVVGETPSGVNPGKVIDSASAVDSNKNLHVLVVTSDGTLCHALRSGAGPKPTDRWTNLANVAAVVSPPPESPHGIGRIRAVTAATDGLNLHVLAATEDGKLWQTVRKGKKHPDTSAEWSGWNRYRTDQQPNPQFPDRCTKVEPGKFTTLTTARVP